MEFGIIKAMLILEEWAGRNYFSALHISVF